MMNENARRFADIGRQCDRARAWGEVSGKLLRWIVADDWPDALTVEDVSLLHAYRDGSVDAASKGRMIEYLEQCIYHEEIDDFEHVRLQRPPMDIDPSVPPWRAKVRVVRASDCARVLSGVDVGPVLKLWLSPFHVLTASPGVPESADQVEAGAGQAVQASAPQGEAPVPPHTQASRINAWLDECERRAKKAEIAFDRKAMPGKKAEFLMLLHALDADLRSIKRVSSLTNYLKKCGCTWPSTAGTQESALKLYASLFPEAKGLDGVVSTQQRKSA